MTVEPKLTITVARARLNKAVMRGEIERPAACPCCAKAPRRNALKKSQMWATFPHGFQNWRVIEWLCILCYKARLSA